ncbi:unnamed protein product [Orchesella dallaii]|uniref:Uncharacterized protein n=1 Tax=Orchesella dallaii TaxID=48710 RepID=A0ABP1QYK4_9HEXA
MSLKAPVSQLPPNPPKSPKLFRTQKELNKAEEAAIDGKIPSWVKGTFIRIGPGKFDFDKDFVVQHFMDGYALVSKFDVRNGKVRYEKKFLESDAYKKALIAQKPVITEFGTKSSPDPTKSFFSKMVPSIMPELSDNNNINIFGIGGDIYATGETCFFRDIDPDTLKSGNKYDTNKFFGLQMACAHPLTDDDGYTYNVGCSLLAGLKYSVVKIPPAGKNESAKDAFKKAKVLCNIASSNTGLLSFMHSFGMTKNYLIFIEQPYVINAGKVLGSVLAKATPISDWLEWREDLINRFFIVEKATGKVLKADVVADINFFYLHIINSFERDDHIVIDITTFPNTNALTKKMDLAKLRRLSIDDCDNPVGERYVIPLVNLDEVEEGLNCVALESGATAVKKGKQLVVTPEVITERGLELPTINRRFLAKKTSFYYATGSATKGYFENAVCKVHASKKETILWRESEHYCLGEPQFIANPEATTEDDGVLVTAVIDNRVNTQDFLLFLDAKTMKELGRAYFKEEIPTAVHGIWLPEGGV